MGCDRSLSEQSRAPLPLPHVSGPRGSPLTMSNDRTPEDALEGRPSLCLRGCLCCSEGAEVGILPAATSQSGWILRSGAGESGTGDCRLSSPR